MDNVGIVVVTYNRLALLKEAVTSLRNQSYKSFKIIIINNGSTDWTLEWLNDQTDLIVITQKNIGGAGGFYTGLKYVAEHDFDYCWCMDDDVICDVNSLHEFFNALKKIKGDWGFLCSAISDKNGNPTNVTGVDMRCKDGFPDWTRYLSNGVVKLRGATFVSIFIPTRNIYKYGLPLKEFFIWCDDTEYTLRLSRSLPCYLVGNSHVTHMRENVKGLAFLDEKNPLRMRLYYYFYRNQFYLARNHCFNIKLPILRYYYKNIYILFKAVSSFKFKHSMIILKAILVAPFFYPEISFPFKVSTETDYKTHHEKNEKC